jgi:hypothetical protein
VQLRYAGIMRRDAIRDAGLRELGAQGRLKAIAIDDHGHPRPFEERKKLFAEYRIELKKQHRKIALECHPDRNVDAPEEERSRKEERFKQVTRAVEFLMTLGPRPPAQPRPRVQSPNPRAPGIIVINLGGQPMSMGNFRWGGTTTSGGTGTGSSNYWPWHG